MTENMIRPDSIEDAMRIQNALRHHVRIENDFEPIQIIAGIDVSYDLQTKLTYAFIVLLDYQTLQPITWVKATQSTSFPYRTGFLSFREIPTILDAYQQLQQKPQMLMVDGQGIAHPRRLGIASHLGALLDMPSIGVAKSRLIGSYTMPGPSKGETSPLVYKKERIGTVLRSRDNVKPLFISPGHRVDVDTALQITQHCLVKYRLPEPTRLADKLSKQKKTEA